MFRHRSKPKPNSSPTADLEALIASEIKSVEKLDGAVTSAAAICAADLPAECEARAVRVTNRGVLILEVPSASARWLAECNLRSGVERKLVVAGKGKVRKVRVEVRAGGPR